MIRFIENPNLPQGKIKTVICGELCDKLNSYLDSIGVQRIIIEPNNLIDEAVKFHADMAAIHLGINKVLLDKNQVSLSEKLLNSNFDVYYSERSAKEEYPYDVGLNFALFGNNLMGNFRYADNKLLELTTEYNRIDVKQGYCKCSCLIVSDNAVITDDNSIYKALKAYGVYVLLVNKGDIRLDGHDYGFIGGASCKISKENILFFGDVTKHRDYKKIADFIKKHGCEIISLDFPLTDFGGMITVCEEV